MDKLHEESRKQFEEWFKDSYHLAEEHLCLGQFGSDTVQTSWKAWQASRASIVVELPDPRDDRARNRSVDDIAYGFNQGIDACSNSLRSIGLSIKGG